VLDVPSKGSPACRVSSDLKTAILIYSAPPMTNALRTQIHQFAAQFAAAVLTAVRGASLEDILAETTAGAPSRSAAPTKGKRGRGRPKGSKNRSPAAKHAVASAKAAPRKVGRPAKTNTAGIVESIVAYVRQHPATSGEAARKSLGIDRNKWSPSVAKAIESKKLRKQGERRSTKYWAV
jgi:hypothetical protein